MEALMLFVDKAFKSETPLMTSIMLDNETTLLRLWASSKYLTPFERIESLIKQDHEQKKLLLKCSKLLEQHDKEGNFGIISDIKHALNKF